MTEGTEPEKAGPRLFDHCTTVFEQMAKEATSTRLSDGGGDRHALVYEGFLTQMFEATLGMPKPYYTTVMRKLSVMGCVRQLNRGGGGSPSRWELFHEPTMEAYTESDSKTKKQPSRLDMLEKSFADLTRSVVTLQENQEMMLSYFRDQARKEGS